MKALRLKIFQPTACYKMPMHHKTIVTYPLPPYSTVKGVIHSMIDAKEFTPMLISIQGEYQAKGWNYQKMSFHYNGRETYYEINSKGEETRSAKQDKTMPINVPFLHNVNLIIHVHAEEWTMKDIHDKLVNCDKTPWLGRREDLALLEAMDWVDLALKERGKYKLPLNTYIPRHSINTSMKDIGALYDLNWKYEIRKIPKTQRKNRVWETITTYYCEKNWRPPPPFYYDGEYPVFFQKNSLEEV